MFIDLGTVLYNSTKGAERELKMWLRRSFWYEHQVRVSIGLMILAGCVANLKFCLLGVNDGDRECWVYKASGRTRLVVGRQPLQGSNRN